MKFYPFLLIALTGCSALAPKNGSCPLLTQGIALGAGYGGATAAIDIGHVSSQTLVNVGSNIDAVVSSGSVNLDSLDVAISQEGGVLLESFFGVAIEIFKNDYQSAVESNLDANACTIPVLHDIASGIYLGVATAGKSSTEKLKPFTH